MVPKPGESIRICINFRKVNEVSRFDACPMPVVLGLSETLGRAQYLFRYQGKEHLLSPACKRVYGPLHCVIGLHTQ